MKPRSFRPVFSLAALGLLALTGGACGSDGGGASPDGGGGGDPAKYNFETDVQGWASTGSQPITNIMTTSTQKAAGAKALVGTIMSTGDSTEPFVMEVLFSGTLPTISPGSKATFHVHIPTDAAVSGFQPYLNEGDTSTPPYRFTGSWGNPMPGTWQTIEVMAPSDVTGLLKAGVQFFVNGAWTGQVYVDSVDWH